MNINEILNTARINRRALVLDGAMGALLQERYGSRDMLWTSDLNAEYPQAVLEAHSEYIDAGADIITTNTFRSNPAAVSASSKYSYTHLAKAGIEIAKQAAKGTSVIVAGSNPPAEDCYKSTRSLFYKELEYNHRNHIKVLIDNGCDLILNETQSHMDEIEIICRYCSSENIPYIVSLFVTPELKLLSGEPAEEAVRFIEDYNPAAVSFNCISSNTLKIILNKIKFGINWGYYLNCGSGNITDESITCGVTPEEYAREAEEFMRYSPSFIGACCGSSPAHIKQLRRLLH